MRSAFRYVFAMVVTACFVSLLARPIMAQTAGATEGDSAVPFVTLNNASRVFLSQAKTVALENHGPVIIVMGDDLILKKGSTRTQVRVIPEIYHVLKAIAHVPMAIEVALAAREENAFQSQDPSPFDKDRKTGVQPPRRPLPDEVLHQLRAYRDVVKAAEARLGTIEFSAEQRERQKAILGGSSAFLDSILATKSCSPVERTAFSRRMATPILANSADAARAQLDALHRQVGKWRDELGRDDEWANLSVLIIGRQLPRKDNLAVQYFARLLDESGEGRRIIYAEGMTEESRALDLLATHRIETQIAVEFFNDDRRLTRDLLSDAVREYLPRLLDDNPPSP